MEKPNQNQTLCNVLGLQLLAQSAYTSCKEHLQIKHWMKCLVGSVIKYYF